MIRPPLFNIPAHSAFVDALAAGLMARAGGDPMALSGGDPLVLARTLVLLPNRRAVTALTEAFVRQMGDAGLLLPRMVPIGDLDDPGLDRLASDAAALLPAVPPLLRRFELARLVQRLPTGQASLASGQPRPRGAGEAMRLGDALGETLDALLEAEIDPAALKTAVADDTLAEHWQRTLAFLDLVISAWPPARARLGGSDGRTRLAALVDAAIAGWRTAPPSRMVVAAGFANPSPPVLRLLAAVLALPRGLVVLPGLDTDMTAAGQARWDAVIVRDHGNLDDRRRASAEHPGWGVKALLTGLGLDRSDVQNWAHAGGTSNGPAERDGHVMAALAPAAASAAPLDNPGEAFAGVRAITCASAAEEAQVVALALREALEVPDRRASLVTADRTLARRVAAHCRRWGIRVDDSAGTPLRLTPPGALLLALVDAMAQGFAPVALLSVLGHSLVGQADSGWRRAVHRADLALRGVRPPPGLDAMAEALDRALTDAVEAARDPAQRVTAADTMVQTMVWWKTVDAALAPLAALAPEGRGETDLTVLAGALRQSAAALAGDAMWSGPDGRMLASRIAEIEQHGAVLGRFDVAEAPALMALLLADGAVRVPGAGHHRLAILGPVEAQLARADVMILAGMNEGSWPARPAPDPWLAPAIRSALGLPGTARALGLAAQDFVRALGAPEVLLTRARRDASGPKIASRLWLRLDAYAGGLQGRDDLIALARALDRNNAAPIIPQRPAPAPPLALRPRQLSITDIDTLINDPFAFHAKAILRLRPLEALELDPTAAQRGQIIHGVMEAWIKQGHGTLDQLARIAAERLTTEAAHFPLLRALWLPRAQNAITWAGVQVLAREGEWPQMWAEAAGSLILSNGVTLRGRLDRVDISADGRLAITDYKTGKPPSAKRVRGLEANQLALGLAIAAAGRLATEKDALPKGRPDDMSYWQLGGGQDKPGEIFRVLFHGDKQQITAEELVDKALEVAVDRTSHFLLTTAPFLPKLRPAHAWGDYDHLARVAEWAGRPAANGAPS